MENATKKNMVYCRLKELIAEKERDEKRDISYRVIAAETGISTATIVKLASWDGIKRIDASTIEALCNFFKCTVGDLLVYDKTRYSNSSLEPDSDDSTYAPDEDTDLLPTPPEDF